ncbi:signal recognition particle 19 kDa protein-like [Watersipora subatra]|uniref:signal recognition particle 19 kDa protein-like n=1 Tax=Watersipora subatra TaxID=2589382 RepID=UPI00355BF7C2
MARAYSPDFSYTDREKWICIYPAYLNSKKTIAEGRRIAKELAVENPTYQEIKDVCVSAGLTVGVENKVYPRELNPRDPMVKGRIRIMFKDESGKPLHSIFPTKKTILLHVAEMIPRLKSRIQKQHQQQQAAQQASKQSSNASGGGKNKGKNKKR